jgi:hypothetical protein
MNTEYQTTKSQTLADIGIGILATIFLFTCWGREGWLFQSGLIWAGTQIGYLGTVYLNGQGEDE